MRPRIVVVAFLVAIGVVAVLAFLLRDTTTPIEAGELSAGFSGEVGTAPGEPGIYRYRTSGFETIDALQGARHDYPSETFMTITAGECGPIVRWDALAERWISWQHCGPDLAIDRSGSYHEWFGIPDLEVESCDPPRPVRGEPGSVTEITCTAGDNTESYLTEILEPVEVQVGDESIVVDRIRRTSALGGAGEGVATVEVDRLTGTPLIVRMTVSRSSVNPSAAGDVTYVEEFILDLVALMPSG
jgi:hypothetical protein